MGSKTTPRESAVERAKRDGRQLRGTIAEQLAGDAPSFEGDDLQLLKFHGIYQQDDRDHRRERRSEGKAYQFMIRVALPGGRLSAEQYLALDELTEELADGSLRVTTRQGLQYHGVVKGDLKGVMARVNQSLVSTLAACGDVSRNVMACPAPLDDPTHRAVQEQAAAIAAELRPRSRAYHEIWLDGERQTPAIEEEPFYGDRYLPRKFKVAVGLARDNCVDLFAHDVALAALVDAGEVTGYDLLVGGGLGMTHGKGDTIARLAEPLGRVEPDQAVEAARIVAAIFRDHGNRADRRHARLKYLLAEWGIDRFRAEFEARASFALAPFVPLDDLAFHDHLGAIRQSDGKWCYGVFVQSGRIADRDGQRLRTALRGLVGVLRPGVRFTPHQNVLLTDLEPADVLTVESVLRSHGIGLLHELPSVRRYSMACPALPTCGLAVAESERALPDLLAGLEPVLDRLGPRRAPRRPDDRLPQRVRPSYTADLAFVGRSLDLYHVYVGGGLRGDSITDLYLADVRAGDLIASVTPLLERWAAERAPGEGLGAYHRRALGDATPRRVVTGKEIPRGPIEGPGHG
ncbi:MAG: NADPH-dependent assimilatory sulfite reductase hemoprotein subunit [Gemmatimonadales bacterium]